MINSTDLKYIQDCTHVPILEAKAMAKLLIADGINIYSDEAMKTMQMYGFRQKAARYKRYLEIKELIKEFGSLED